MAPFPHTPRHIKIPPIRPILILGGADFIVQAGLHHDTTFQLPPRWEDIKAGRFYTDGRSRRLPVRQGCDFRPLFAMLLITNLLRLCRTIVETREEDSPMLF